MLENWLKRKTNLYNEGKFLFPIPAVFGTTSSKSCEKKNKCYSFLSFAGKCCKFYFECNTTEWVIVDGDIEKHVLTGHSLNDLIGMRLI
jgi:hypothetical protein